MPTRRTPYILSAFAIAAVIVGCATGTAIRPALPAIATAILGELDRALDAYEAATNDPVTRTSNTTQRQDLQTARRVPIESLLDDLAENHPEINLTRPLERLNNATGLPPP